MRVCGKNPVIERIKSNPKSIKLIYMLYAHEDAGYILKKAKKWDIPVFQVTKSKLQKISRSINAQGLVMEIEGFEYLTLDDLLEIAERKKHALLFLDGLTDPQNLGGIIRSLACLGNFVIVIPTHDSVEVTDTVLRVACGGDNYVKVAKVANLSQAIARVKDQGYWIAGSLVEGGEDIYKVKLPFPLGLVVGSEQKGIRESIRKQIDVAVTIPMAQTRLSMNAAHAASILCYEIVRQKQNNITEATNT